MKYWKKYKIKVNKFRFWNRSTFTNSFLDWHLRSCRDAFSMCLDCKPETFEWLVTTSLYIVFMSTCSMRVQYNFLLLRESMHYTFFNKKAWTELRAQHAKHHKSKLYSFLYRKVSWYWRLFVLNFWCRSLAVDDIILPSENDNISAKYTWDMRTCWMTKLEYRYPSAEN